MIGMTSFSMKPRTVSRTSFSSSEKWSSIERKSNPSNFFILLSLEIRLAFFEERLGAFLHVLRRAQNAEHLRLERARVVEVEIVTRG